MAESVAVLDVLKDGLGCAFRVSAVCNLLASEHRKGRFPFWFGANGDVDLLRTERPSVQLRSVIIALWRCCSLQCSTREDGIADELAGENDEDARAAMDSGRAARRCRIRGVHC